MLKKFSVLSVAFALLVSFSLIAHAAPAALYNPEPIPVSQATLPQVRFVVRMALHMRGWTAEEKDSNHLVGTLVLRKHKAVIDITYDTKAVKIKYMDSSELDYAKDGETETIHKNYNGWIQNLEKDIEFGLKEVVRI